MDFMISVKKWTTNPPHSDTLNVHFKLVRWGFKTGSLVKSLVYMYYQSGQESRCRDWNKHENEKNVSIQGINIIHGRSLLNNLKDKAVYCRVERSRQCSRQWKENISCHFISIADSNRSADSNNLIMAAFSLHICWCAQRAAYCYSSSVITLWTVLDICVICARPGQLQLPRLESVATCMWGGGGE